MRLLHLALGDSAAGSVRAACHSCGMPGSALMSMLSRGEPSIRPGPTDYLLWFAVMCALGIGNALAAYAVGSWLRRRR